MGFCSDNRFTSLQFISLREHEVEYREHEAQETRDLLSSLPPCGYFPIQWEEAGSHSQGPGLNFFGNSFLILAETEK